MENNEINKGKAGRPNMRRMETRLSIRANREELEAWKQTGREAGFHNLASYFRSLMSSRYFVNDEKKHLLAELNEATNQVARCGNNLNQIAYHLNAGGHEDASRAVSECRDIIKTMKRIIMDIRR